MVHWGWLIFVLFIGIGAGTFLIGLLAANRDNTEYQRGYQEGHADGFNDGIKEITKVG